MPILLATAYMPLFPASQSTVTNLVCVLSYHLEKGTFPTEFQGRADCGRKDLPAKSRGVDGTDREGGILTNIMMEDCVDE